MAETVLAVHEHLRELGWAPTVAEVAERLGVSPPAAHQRLRMAAVQGWLIDSGRGWRRYVTRWWRG